MYSYSFFKVLFLIALKMSHINIRLPLPDTEKLMHIFLALYAFKTHSCRLMQRHFTAYIKRFPTKQKNQRTV